MKAGTYINTPINYWTKVTTSFTEKSLYCNLIIKNTNEMTLCQRQELFERVQREGVIPEINTGGEVRQFLGNIASKR